MEKESRGLCLQTEEGAKRMGHFAYNIEGNNFSGSSRAIE